MKKLLLFIAVIAIITGCSKKEVTNDNPVDIWNGYGNLKSSAPTAPLYAGQTIEVGSVTYGLEEVDGVGYFTATYNLDAGWTMSESHLFAGDKAEMPLNKPGNPKIGRFPYAADHNPAVSTYTYYVPLSDLPPYEDPGFTTAAHCVVHGPNGQTETAWRHDDFDFPGKRWGWFGTFYYDQASNPFTILYATEHTSDGTLSVYLINTTTGTSTQILSEEVGVAGADFDGTAFDVESGYFIFTDNTTNVLYGINLNDESVVENLGNLGTPTQSATFYDGNYYYVDDMTNELIEVTFDSNMQILSESTISTIPGSVTVQDITFSPDGSNIFMVANIGDGSTELITLDVALDIYSSLNIAVEQNAQIAYGSDNLLYTVETDINNNTIVSTLDPSTGTLTTIEENGSEVVDPFADLAGGPVM